VIDCKPETSEILVALEYVFGSEFQKTLKNVVNPYGNGGASEKIVEFIQRAQLSDSLKKKFYDLESVS